jgi:hypothetical protein
MLLLRRNGYHFLMLGEIEELPRTIAGEMPWIVAPSSSEPLSETVGVETAGKLIELITKGTQIID